MLKFGILYWKYYIISCHLSWGRGVNEMDFKPPLCTHRLNWAKRTPEDGDMDEMTLPSRHSSHGGLRPSTLPLGHRILTLHAGSCTRSSRRMKENTSVRCVFFHLPYYIFLFWNSNSNRGLNPYSAGIDTIWRQYSSDSVLTCKVDPRTVRVNIFIMAVEP